MPAANPAPGSPVEGAPRLTRTLLLLMCLATGLCAGGNYFNQPLLDRIAQTLGVSEAAAAGSVTVAQVAYAVGLLLITPLGDLLERSRLTVGLILLTAAGQLAAGFTPVFGVFLLGVGAAGLFSVAAQVLVPYAALLAPPGREGRAVGTVMSGLLAGILVARAVAGLLAELGGWTLVYRVAALLMVLVALGLWRTLPPSRPQDPPTYLGLFASMARLLRTQRLPAWHKEGFQQLQPRGVVRRGGLDVAFGRERVRHTMGIVDVHLAAVGLDEELLGSGHAFGGWSSQFLLLYQKVKSSARTAFASPVRRRFSRFPAKKES